MTTNEFEHVDIKHPLLLSHAYGAPSSAVFSAWTTPSIAEQWLFKNETNQLTFEIDLQEGGEFSVMEFDHGKTTAHFGEFLKISKPHVLVFTLAVPDHFEGVSVVRVDMEDSKEGCTLTLTQTNVDTTKTNEAWRLMLTQLEDVLKNQSDGNSLNTFYEASSAKESTLTRMVLEDHNMPYRMEQSLNIDGHMVQKYMVDKKDDQWMQQNLGSLDLSLEHATDADLLRRFDDELSKYPTKN